jgi:hypothetical protein
MYYFNTSRNLKLFIKHNHTKYLSNQMFGNYQMYYIPNKSPNKIHMRIDKFRNNGIFGTTLWGDVDQIAGVDIAINKETQLTYIDEFMINDANFAKLHNNLYGNPLSPTEAQLIKNIVFDYIDNTSRKHNIKQNQIDIHYNLKEYSNIKQYGYKLTNIESEKHLLWIKTFKYL